MKINVHLDLACKPPFLQLLLLLQLPLLLKAAARNE
jgi:hypothetical protein